MNLNNLKKFIIEYFIKKNYIKENKIPINIKIADQNEVNMIDFTKLDPTFNSIIQQLITNMQTLGHKVNLTSGWRSLDEECRLYRRSRSLQAINAEICFLDSKGAGFTAQTLHNVGPQPHGPWATNTVMWSQHLLGWAVDFLIDNRIEGDDPVYKVLFDEAAKLGLTTGLNFSTPDPGHVQFHAQELDQLFTYQEMDAKLRDINS